MKKTEYFRCANCGEVFVYRENARKEKPVSKELATAAFLAGMIVPYKLVMCVECFEKNLAKSRGRTVT